MNARIVAAEYRLSHWAQIQIIESRGTSEVSIREFCKQAGYREHVYYYWQHKLREAACQELLPAVKGRRDADAVPAGWAVCAAKETLQSRKPVTIEIGGCKIRAEADVDPDQLKQVCRILLSLC